jgi:hypothetical protein
MSPLGTYGSLSSGCPLGCRGYQFNLEYYHATDCPRKPAADREREQREKARQDQDRRAWWERPDA